MWDDDRRPDDEVWYDSQPVVVAGGVAGLLLVGLLVYAVVQVSQSSVDPPAVRYPDASETANTSYTTPTTTTASYRPPSVQTSELGPAPAGPPPAPPPDGADQPTTNDTPTTIYNPYAPTTTAGSAGHI